MILVPSTPARLRNLTGFTLTRDDLEDCPLGCANVVRIVGPYCVLGTRYTRLSDGTRCHREVHGVLELEDWHGVPDVQGWLWR